MGIHISKQSRLPELQKNEKQTLKQQLQERLLFFSTFLAQVLSPTELRQIGLSVLTHTPMINSQTGQG
ncbi:hypothetical protein DHL47_03275 [Streptococcus panodentis]|uniref:Uncharacterized protein n=1 Tax=Streptococcus panodentis TaxID=1581472 RepID=A0ABS5AV59_9STRE|nr:hypothetical protein STRDD11_01088 [Streptococcus sp. DD11]MBP2620370.1 hypothetical protein [Streptococcus panodentis]